MTEILVPISIGELYDKISILYLKITKIKDRDKLLNINAEFNQLSKIAKDYPIDDMIFGKLVTTNSILWNLEDEIRKKDSAKEFDNIFIELAQNIYHTNDIRSDLKREINTLYNSSIIEEKSYDK